MFCADIATAESATDVLLGASVSAATYHSGLTQDDREDILDDLQDGGLQAIVAVNALDEGIDVPDLDLGIIVSGSRSRRQMVQRMGRVLRRTDDDRGAAFLLLYTADTTEDPERSPDGAVKTLINPAPEVRSFRDVFEPDEMASFVGSMISR